LTASSKYTWLLREEWLLNEACAKTTTADHLTVGRLLTGEARLAGSTSGAGTSHTRH